MERTSVRSSNLSSVGYDVRTATLEVAFHSGGVYQYAGVPLTTYEGLMAASSHGSYLARHIKNRFSYRRVR